MPIPANYYYYYYYYYIIIIKVTLLAGKIIRCIAIKNINPLFRDSVYNFDVQQDTYHK